MVRQVASLIPAIFGASVGASAKKVKAGETLAGQKPKGKLRWLLLAGHGVVDRAGSGAIESQVADVDSRLAKPTGVAGYTVTPSWAAPISSRRLATPDSTR